MFLPAFSISLFTFAFYLVFAIQTTTGLASFHRDSSLLKGKAGVTRNILYIDQTVGRDGNNIQNLSLLPLIHNPTQITHIILFSLYFEDDATVFYQGAPFPHQNTTQQLADANILQQHGVKVLMCLGGAGNQPFNQLAADFTKFYPPLLSFLRTHSFDGLDLDIELPTTLSATIRLLQSLKADLGPDFILTLAPVSSTMITNAPIAVSGNLDYRALDAAAIYDPNTISSPSPSSIISFPIAPTAANPPANEPSSLSKLIDFFNVQFFAGGASGGSVFDTYTKIIEEGGWEPERIVAGIASFGLPGWDRVEEYKGNLSTLRIKYGAGTFGGAVGWSFFHAGNNDRKEVLGEEGAERKWRWVKMVGEGVFGK